MSLTVPSVPSVTFDEPTLFYTVHDGNGTSNPRCVRVIHEIKKYLASGTEAVVYDKASDVPTDRRNAVAFFDCQDGRVNQFSPRQTSMVSDTPSWARSAEWCVLVGRHCAEKDNRIDRCAKNASALFGKCFNREIEKELYPWGPPRKGTNGPKETVVIDPSEIEARLTALNSGPNLAEAIADKAFASELPPGSRISWYRVPPSPLGYNREEMQRVVGAMRRFEQASHALLLRDEEVQRIILSGVTFREEHLRELYLDPGTDCFTVARPDLHFTEDGGLAASENDEMPGGMPELVMIDHAYGLGDRWKPFFDFLTSNGPLIFLVSHEWSRCYIPETTWLVEHLRKQGYDARILATDALQLLTVTESGVFYENEPVGTIWRQFPIFETEGVLSEIVNCAKRGKVRLFPEWGHFGNKAWFHIFWKYRHWYEKGMSKEDIEVLSTVIPESRLVEGQSSFPFSIGGKLVWNVDELKSLPESARDELVLKICGANSLAARSYGVLMGKGIKESAWRTWISDRLALKEPFLVQSMFKAGVAKIPVWNTSTGHAEIFRAKLLMRPWVLNGEIVSVHGCAVPHFLHKVHGMVSMAVTPVDLI